MNAPDESIPVAPARPAVAEEVALYEIRKKIYPRAVTGTFARWRWAMIFATQLVYYGLPWLSWNDRQAVLFDIAARKFYIFGLVFWPQDVIYLSVLLILAAFSLFLFTAIAGRLWCGFACPQTVYTEIFLWVERKIEGDRAARMLLDRQPFSARKLGKKAAKHAIWIAIALWTGITFVGYFTPFRTLLAAIPAGLGGWETFWILFYGFATYGNAGWMREQVCKYMCPYARFQSVMFDRDTLVITYDGGRGEPRGSRSRKVDLKAAGLGALRRLLHLRAGLPDRHRHPQGPAVRVHRLRRLHRRLRPGDGPDGLSARTDPLRDGECAGEGLRPGDDGEARVPRPHARLHGVARRDRRCRRRRVVPAGAAQGRRDPRPRRARARSRAGRRSRTSTGCRS